MTEPELDRALRACSKLEPSSEWLAATRALLEKEKTLRGPTGTLQISSVSGDPDKWVDTVRTQFERHMPELQLCYDRTLQKVPNARGLVRFVVTYTESGPSVDLAPKPGEQTAAFARCALIQMFAWRFEYVGGARPEAAIIVELEGQK